MRRGVLSLEDVEIQESEYVFCVESDSCCTDLKESFASAAADQWLNVEEAHASDEYFDEAAS